jgi:hypothetical protein
MKQFILSVSALILSFSSFAQQYVPMPTDSAWWLYTSVMGGEGHTEYSSILILAQGDTVWSGHTYTKLMTRGDSYDIFNGNPGPTSFIAEQPDAFIGGMREENKIVYVRKYGVPEKVLFDFNLQVGGSFNIDQNTTVTVTDIDQILIGSSYRKRYTTTAGKYIEGVGSDMIGIMSLFGSFICFHSDQSYNNGDYSPQQSNDCHYIYPFGTALSVFSGKQEDELSIYPNPVNDVMNINYPTQGTIVIYNAIGQKACAYSINKGLNTIDVRQLSQGLYNVVVRDEHNTVITTRKIIKQ